MATQATYCSTRDLKDVFPEVDSFDTKTPIYGWVSLGNSLYRLDNAGLVTNLYKDGKELTQTMSSSIINSTASTGETISEAVVTSETSITVSDASDANIFPGAILKIGSEYLLVATESTNTLTVERGVFDSTIAAHDSSAAISYVLDSDALQLAIGSEYFDWFADVNYDRIYLYSSSDPNDSLMESGDDWVTVKNRYMKNASEYLDSRLDGTLPRERFKDQDGNYDYIIVRTSALISAVFLIRSHDPTSEVASALWDEAAENIDKINKGETKLSWQITQSDSQGVVRQTSDTGNLRIVDTRGRYVGTYDRIGVRITTAGAIGTAKYSVWNSDGDKIGAEIMAETSGTVTATTDADITEVVDGMYQSLAGGLQIRFAGDTGDTAVAGDAWEIEVTGKYEAVDNARPKTIKMTRRGTPQAFRWQ